MRIRLLIDIETDDLERLQRYVADQPGVDLRFLEDGALDEYDRVRLDWVTRGRFVGAKEAHDSAEEVAVAADPKELS